MCLMPFFILADQKQQWEEQQAMYIALRYPEDHKKRKRRKRIRQRANDDSPGNNEVKSSEFDFD